MYKLKRNSKRRNSKRRNSKRKLKRRSKKKSIRRNSGKKSLKKIRTHVKNDGAGPHYPFIKNFKGGDIIIYGKQMDVDILYSTNLILLFVPNEFPLKEKYVAEFINRNKAYKIINNQIPSQLIKYSSEFDKNINGVYYGISIHGILSIKQLQKIMDEFFDDFLNSVNANIEDDKKLLEISNNEDKLEIEKNLEKLKYLVFCSEIEKEDEKYFFESGGKDEDDLSESEEEYFNPSSYYGLYQYDHNPFSTHSLKRS